MRVKDRAKSGVGGRGEGGGKRAFPVVPRFSLLRNHSETFATQAKLFVFSIITLMTIENRAL